MIAEWLEHRRELLGWSYADIRNRLPSEARPTVRTLRRWLAGEAPIPDDAWRHLLDAMAVPVSDVPWLCALRGGLRPDEMPASLRASGC